MFDVEDKIEAMIIKLKVWEHRLSQRNFDAFGNLKILCSTNNGNLSDEILNYFIQHRTMLFSRIFSNFK